MLAEQQAQSRQLKHWSHTAKARTRHPLAKTPAPKPTAGMTKGMTDRVSPPNDGGLPIPSEGRGSPRGSPAGLVT
jgi:hypothetical protein